MTDASPVTTSTTTMSEPEAAPTQPINTKWYHYITVEPTMFLYMFAFQLTSVIEQAFFVHKACQVNHNYSAEICNNLTQYVDINKDVQVKGKRVHVDHSLPWIECASNVDRSFSFANREPFRRSISGITFPVMWCRLRLRYFWVRGQIDGVVSCHCCLDCLANSCTQRQSFWMPWMVRNLMLTPGWSAFCDKQFSHRWLATGIRHLHGHNSERVHWNRRCHFCICLCLHFGCFGWKISHASSDHFGGVLSDDVPHWHQARLLSIQSRLRSLVPHHVQHKCSLPPAGDTVFHPQFEGKMSQMNLLNPFIDRSTSDACYFQWLTTDKQRSITEIKCTGILSDFFDRQHVVDSIRTLTKYRPSNRRMYLCIFMVAMLCYTFQRDERPMTYLYTQYKFKWGTEEFSDFKTVQSTMHISMLLGGIPVMTKLFQWRDTTIAMVGACNFAAARMFFAFAEVPWVFYVGGFISGIGPVVGPILRSMTSKVVSSSERGKVFALLSVCDNAVPFISGILYSQVYNYTLGKFPGIFFLTAATQAIVFILML